MFRSQAFLKSLSGTTGDDRVACFTRYLPPLPNGLADDLYAGVEERIGDSDQFDQTLAEIVDLMWMQYDDTGNPLEIAEWRLLRELVDQYAVELDMPRVEYIMERVVAHHALDD